MYLRIKLSFEKVGTEAPKYYETSD